MANRIYFANQQVAFRRDAETDGANYKVAHGVQSVAVTTTFNLEQAFELGQLSIYENIEGVPDIEITASKVLDGYPLLYHLATDEAEGHAGSPHGPDLAGRSNAKCLIALGIWPDTDNFAAGISVQQMEASGMFPSSVSYNFPLEDNFSEDITLVGNDKGWRNGVTADAIGCATPPWGFTGALGGFDGQDVPKASGVNYVAGSAASAATVSQEGGVNRRENLKFYSERYYDAGGADYTYLPTQIPGVDDSGWMNPKVQTDNAHLQSITISTDLGREELFELGTRQPYARVVTFPVEVTCDIEVVSISGDLINAFADGCGSSTDPCTGVTDNLNS